MFHPFRVYFFSLYHNNMDYIITVILCYSQKPKYCTSRQNIVLLFQYGDNDLEMRSFDDKVMKACDFLKDLTPKQELCLKTFVRCEPLVKWLKESMKTGNQTWLHVFLNIYLFLFHSPQRKQRYYNIY